MTRADIALKFAVATLFVVAGALPIVACFGFVMHVFGGLESAGRRWPAVFLADAHGFGHASLVIVACVLAFSVGAALLMVGVGRSFELRERLRNPIPRSYRPSRSAR